MHVVVGFFSRGAPTGRLNEARFTFGAAEGRGGAAART